MTMSLCVALRAEHYQDRTTILFVFVPAKDAMALVVEDTSLYHVVNPRSGFESRIELNERFWPERTST